jgi:hypothetical protein
MHRSPGNAASPSRTESAHQKPPSTVQLFGKERILQEWQSSMDALSQRDKEMVTMSKEFADYINSARDEMDVMLQANHTMLEESRRRGLHLKKLETFFADFPFPYSLRQPVASAFLSVGIQMPWWNGKSEPKQLMPNFSDTDVVDAEDLCSRFKSVLEMKDQLTQQLLDVQSKHEEEMESFILYHKKSIATAQQNAMLSATHWTIERLTLQSRLQERETEIKVLNQEIDMLKESMEKLRRRSNIAVSHEQMARKHNGNNSLESDWSVHVNDRELAYSPRNRIVTTQQQLTFDRSPILSPSNMQLKGEASSQSHEDNLWALQQYQQSINTPREGPPSSITPSHSVSHSVAQNQWQRQQPERLNKESHPVGSMSNMVRGLKGTKICSEFRVNRAEKTVGGPASTRIKSDAVEYIHMAGFGNEIKSAELRTLPRHD